MNDATWEFVFGGNINSPTDASRKALQNMLRQDGGNINLAPAAAIGGRSAGAAYAVSEQER